MNRDEISHDVPLSEGINRRLLRLARPQSALAKDNERLLERIEQHPPLIVPGQSPSRNVDDAHAGRVAINLVMASQVVQHDPNVDVFLFPSQTSNFGMLR